MNTLLKNGVLWTSSGYFKRDILVTDEKIVRIGEALPASPADQIIDMSEMLLFPGFINCHVHCCGIRGFFDDDLMKRFVTGGVTTVRDMGMTYPQPYSSFVEWRAARKGPEFPTILHCGKFLCGENTYGHKHPTGMVIGQLVNSKEDIQRQVQEYLSLEGAWGVKTGLDPGQDPKAPNEDLPDELFREICRCAAAYGAHAAAHITRSEKLVHAAELGLQETAHIPLNNMTEEQFQRIVASGIAFQSTLSIFDMAAAASGEDIMGYAIENTRRLYRAGLLMGVGTDFLRENPPYQKAGIPVHEFQLLQQAGLTQDEIIRAATEGSAKLCGIFAQTGSLEVGKLADIVAIHGPVDEQFSVFWNVPFVMHRGSIIKRSAEMEDSL